MLRMRGRRRRWCLTCSDSMRGDAHELREIQLLITEHRARFLESWNEFFGIGG
jgi:hypothetical protein